MNRRHGEGSAISSRVYTYSPDTQYRHPSGRFSKTQRIKINIHNFNRNHHKINTVVKSQNCITTLCLRRSGAVKIITEIWRQHRTSVNSKSANIFDITLTQKRHSSSNQRYCDGKTFSLSLTSRRACRFPKPKTKGRQIWPPHRAAKGPATPLLLVVQLKPRRTEQEAQLLLGDRATRNLMWKSPMTLKYAQGHWQLYYLKAVVWSCM